MKKLFSFYLMLFLIVSQDCFGMIKKLPSTLLRLARTTTALRSPVGVSPSRHIHETEQPCQLSKRSKESDRVPLACDLKRCALQEETKKSEEKDTTKINHQLWEKEIFLLCEVVRNGNIDKIAQVLHRNGKTIKKLRELYEAILSSDYEEPDVLQTLEELLKQGISPNGFTLPDDIGFYNPLIMVRYLLKNPLGFTTTIFVDDPGHYEKIERLLTAAGLQELSPLAFARKYKGRESEAEALLLRYRAYDPEQAE
jgi:hypothetical protein